MAKPSSSAWAWSAVIAWARATSRNAWNSGGTGWSVSSAVSVRRRRLASRSGAPAAFTLMPWPSRWPSTTSSQ